MSPATIQLIGKLVEVFVPMLFSIGRGDDARAIQALHEEAKKDWTDLEQWGNSPTLPPTGKPRR